jgi:hypothetical protein
MRYDWYTDYNHIKRQHFVIFILLHINSCRRSISYLYYDSCLFVTKNHLQKYLNYTLLLDYFIIIFLFVKSLCKKYTENIIEYEHNTRRVMRNIVYSLARRLSKKIFSIEDLFKSYYKSNQIYLKVLTISPY